MWDWSKFRGSAEGLKWNRKELATLERVLGVYVRGDGVAVQAGGNLGVFPKRMSSTFQVVYTFEPEPELFDMMVHNVPERNVVKMQAALGFDRGCVRMSRERRQKDGGNAHEGITHVAGEGSIPTLRIDDMELRRCDLIYLDLEGYELFALQGARRTIERCRPVIVCEVNKSLAFMNHTEEDVRTWIRMNEYDFAERIRSDEVYLPRSA